MDETEVALDFYKQHYEMLCAWPQLKPGSRIALGQRAPRVCRFCGHTTPNVSFKLAAHAIPELLGNKSLFSWHECDTCNAFFGSGIENDLGNWSKPMRTLQRIRGKRGVPTLRSESGSWRIECDNDRQFKVTHDRGDPVFTVSEGERRVTFLLNRDPHIPMAVLKAFVKIGISLMPDSEMPNFFAALQWIRNPDHREEFELIAPVSRTFIPGPTVLDQISVALLRRRKSITNLPYAFLLLTTGNETFQVMLPSPKHDPIPGGNPASIPSFPPVRTPYGPPEQQSLDLSGVELLVDEKVSVSMEFEKVETSAV